LCVVR